MTSPARVLIIRPSALGDVCRSVPVLASLSKAYPSAQIDWLVRDVFSDAIAHDPRLTSVLAFRRTALSRDLKRGRVGSTLSWLRQLGQGGYDLVVDCQGLARSGLFAWATRAPRRIGFADAREIGWLGVNERQSVDPELHAVDRMLGLVEMAGIPPVRDMRLYAPAPDAHLTDTLQDLGEGYVAVAPTSAWEGKRWPGRRFVELIKHIRRAHGTGVVLVGGPGERTQCAELIGYAADTPGVHDLIGRTSVGDLMTLIERSGLVIANDSAAVHMAVGFDRPLVALYGPTRIELVGPYRRESDVIQAEGADESAGRAAHKNTRHGVAMMERIETHRVIEAVDDRLGSAAETVSRSSPRSLA